LILLIGAGEPFTAALRSVSMADSLK